MIKAGQRLKDTRVTKRLTIEDVAKATKIRSAFIQAIEKGEYNKLPSPAYASGFVRNYASFLGLPEREILAIFRREFDEEQAFKVLPDSLTTSQDFPRRSLRIQQTLLILFVVLGTFFSYIGYQYRFLVVNPPLSVDNPQEGMTTNQELLIHGKTDGNATVTVNNSPVTMTTTGEFSKKVLLFPGKTTLSIVATNTIGKKTEVKRTITVEETQE